MKNLRFRIAATLSIFALPIAAFAGGGTSTDGGGHGVLLPSGKVQVLDLIRPEDRPMTLKCSDLPKEQIQIQHDSRTRAAAQQAVQALQPFAESYPEFYRRTVRALEERIQWHLSRESLSLVNDHHLEQEQAGRFTLIQLARQCGRGFVVIQEQQFGKLSLQDQTALVLHETLLANLGLKINREVLRHLVRTLLDEKVTDKLGAGEIKKALDWVAPEILQGKHLVFVELSNIHGTARITISPQYGKDQTCRTNRSNAFSNYRDLGGGLSMQDIFEHSQLQHPWPERKVGYWWENVDSSKGRNVDHLIGCDNTVGPIDEEKVKVKIQDRLFPELVNFLYHVFRPLTYPVTYRVHVNNVLDTVGTFELKDGAGQVAVTIDLW